MADEAEMPKADGQKEEAPTETVTQEQTEAQTGDEQTGEQTADQTEQAPAEGTVAEDKEEGGQGAEAEGQTEEKPATPSNEPNPEALKEGEDQPAPEQEEVVEGKDADVEQGVPQSEQQETPPSPQPEKAEDGATIPSASPPPPGDVVLGEDGLPRHAPGAPPPPPPAEKVPTPPPEDASQALGSPPPPPGEGSTPQQTEKEHTTPPPGDIILGDNGMPMRAQGFELSPTVEVSKFQDSQDSIPPATEKEDTAPPAQTTPAPAETGQTQRTGGPNPPPSTPALETNLPSHIPVPPPPMARRETTAPTPDNKMFSDALNLIWSFGMNKNVPVINLTDDNRKQIAYACAHTGVIYDFKSNTQTLLQGHSNAISCLCVSGDKRWLCTADKGNDAMVIIWDSYTGTPVRTIFDPHPDGGVNAIGMTPDAKYIATLSASETQTMALWDWTVEGDEPVCTAELRPEYGMQHYVHFNPEDVSQIVTNSHNRVIFYSWDKDNLQYYAPPLTDEDFNKQVGKYSQSIFKSGSTLALTATSVGNLVVWDTNKPFSKTQNSQSTPDKRALKLLKMQDRGITVLTTTDDFIVTGDVLGHVKFFDQTLKLMNWYQDFHLGPINSLSFAYLPEFDYEVGPSTEYPPDATIRAKEFVIRDFVVGTTSAVYAHVTTDGTNVEIIHRDHDASVHAMASHPTLPRLAVGSYSGLLKVWDYEARDTLMSRHFDKGLHIRCCSFDPQGNYLAVGFTNGSVRVLDALSLEDLVTEPFRYARDVITHAVFSHDSQYLATADGEFTVTLYRRQHGFDVEPFKYVGRHRAHYKTIKDLLFGVQLDSDAPRLLSLGEDRHLVEYDLENSSKDNLPLSSVDRIEQSAIPQCIAWYPPVTKESFIVTANDQFKFKLYNATTKMCRRTLLGPTYGSPLQKVAVIPTADPIKDTRYMAYITNDKVGLHTLPLDGNPHKSMALIAHPNGVVNLASSYDGRFVFTAGGADATVHMWYINKDALTAQATLGGEDLIPFYGLLDGGRDGELFRELEDYFYYGQLRSQGVDTMELRESSVDIPLTEVPYVMRALGFYPSEQEIDDMLNEVKYSNYVETGKYTEIIDLGDFIKLYINHRPAFGLQPEKLLQAFEVLGFPTEQGQYAIDRGDLLDLLQNRGEHMTEYELAEYLTTLLGFNEEGGSSELHEFDASHAGEAIDQSLPLDVTAEMFSDELLGFGMYSNVLPVEGGEEGTQQAV